VPELPSEPGGVVTPYYADDSVTLWHGDCREITDWLSADVLVTDPPYGRDWRPAGTKGRNGWRTKKADNNQPGIVGDKDTSTRDAALALWGDRQAIVFGHPLLAPPDGTKQVLYYRKPTDSGGRGGAGGFRRDVEVIYLIGPWPTGMGGRSSVLETGARCQGNPNGIGGRYGHPHAKPLDVLEELIAACPAGVIADPFAGSGSTLVAARHLRRRALGVELEERYCEVIARRLAQDVLPIGGG
jgi:hypothetical protein